MNKRNKTLVLGVLLAGLLASAGATVLAGPGAHGNCLHGAPYAERGFGERRLERLARRLDMSQQQLDAARAVIDAARPRMRELKDGLRAGRAELRALVHAGDVPEQQLRDLAQAQGNTMAELIVLRTQVRAAIRALLDEHQRARLDEMRGRHGHRI